MAPTLDEIRARFNQGADVRRGQDPKAVARIDPEEVVVEAPKVKAPTQRKIRVPSSVEGWPRIPEESFRDMGVRFDAIDFGPLVRDARAGQPDAIKVLANSIEARMVEVLLIRYSTEDGFPVTRVSFRNSRTEIQVDVGLLADLPRPLRLEVDRVLGRRSSEDVVPVRGPISRKDLVGLSPVDYAYVKVIGEAIAKGKAHVELRLDPDGGTETVEVLAPPDLAKRAGPVDVGGGRVIWRLWLDRGGDPEGR